MNRLLRTNFFITAFIALLFLLARPYGGFCQEFEAQQEAPIPKSLPAQDVPGETPAEAFGDPAVPEEAAEEAADATGLTGLKESIWSRVKGEKARNALVLGMWSSHFSKRKDYRTRHDLVGIQYKGFFCATFANSHNHQVVAAGVSRTVAEKALGRNWLFEAGYKLGPMYGYREGVPRYHRFTVLPLLALGLSFRAVGADLNLVPGNAFSFNMRINF